MQLVDVYDALTTDRAYRKALSQSAALKQMGIEVDKGWWNEELFQVFSTMIQKAAFESEDAYITESDRGIRKV